MEQWLVRAVLVGLGSFIGSLVLENLTHLAVLLFVARIHDVEFVMLITAISTLGGVLGAVSVIAFLLAKAQHYKIAACLILAFGGPLLALCLWVLIPAPQAFDNSQTPRVDALAYVGSALLWSIILVMWGGLLFFQRSSKVEPERVS